MNDAIFETNQTDSTRGTSILVESFPFSTIPSGAAYAPAQQLPPHATQPSAAIPADAVNASEPAAAAAADNNGEAVAAAAAGVGVRRNISVGTAARA